MLNYDYRIEHHLSRGVRVWREYITLENSTTLLGKALMENNPF